MKHGDQLLSARAKCLAEKNRYTKQQQCRVEPANQSEPTTDNTQKKSTKILSALELRLHKKTHLNSAT
jgi:hypothetical protein